MVALNAVGLTPISALSKPRKSSPLPTNLPLKSSSSSDSSSALKRSFPGSLVLLSSVFSSSTSIAHSLTYEEALQQSVTSSTDSIDNILDSIISFGTDNPLVVAGGAAALVLPLLLSQLLFKKPKPWGIETARAAYAKLGEDANAQLLDIRGPAELRKVGGPDVRGLGKKPLSIVYKGEDKPGFLKNLSLKVKDPENTTLFILDKFDGNSELVAELVAVNGFKAAYAIRDGAEGPRGWTSSGLPWIPPKKAFSLDFSSLTDAISGDGSDGLSVALSIAAAAGLGALAFTEVETILQVLGSAALIQFVSKKFLFAEDRKQTIEQIDEFLNTKVAPKELVDEIKQIGKALLPSAVTSKTLPAPKPSEATPETMSTETAAEKIETAVEKIETAVAAAAAAVEAVKATTEEPKIETVAVEVNSVPKPIEQEVKAESIAGNSRPQSPYPYYPDLKPPASPSPSQP